MAIFVSWVHPWNTLGHTPDLSGLTALRTLELSGNKFDGEAPSLLALSALRVLAWQGPGHGQGLFGGLRTMLPSRFLGAMNDVPATRPWTRAKP